MASRQLDEEAIFHVAREIHNRDVRGTYLNQACGDQPLRERVDALLLAHEQAQSLLKSNNLDPAATADPVPMSERQGTTIGRYRLMEQIGEGGMGIVFVAEQEKPLRRKVALKVIKPGMDNKIDFGVAKALHQRLTERTVYTSFAQVVGTPLYMSPEQAELSGLDTAGPRPRDSRRKIEVA